MRINLILNSFIILQNYSANYDLDVIASVKKSLLKMHRPILMGFTILLVAIFATVECDGKFKEITISSIIKHKGIDLCQMD